MDETKQSPAARRDFLKLAAGGAAALIAHTQPLKAEEPVSPADVPATGGVEVLTTDRPGSDFMVDVLKTLNFEYIASNPASDFRGLQESFINYGGNKNPEWITCLHEDSSVSMAHGYFTVEGRPMAVAACGAMGTPHAALALLCAYRAKAPVYFITGNDNDSPDGATAASHSAQDVATMVRDVIKWDDAPLLLSRFADSAVRAYQIAMTPPTLPVMLVAYRGLQEAPMDPGPKPYIPKLTLRAAPVGDPGAVEEAARMLVAAENPVIRIGDPVTRTATGIQLIVELAELLQAPTSGANFPSRHRLRGGSVADADVVLGLEIDDFYYTVNSYRDQLGQKSKPIVKPGTKMISITAMDLYAKSNYQDLNRFQETDLGIAADAAATLPSLIEACKKLIDANRRVAIQARGARVAAANLAERERNKRDAAIAWDQSPISHPRLAYELWEQIKNKDWSMVAGADEGRWAQRVWDFSKPYHYTGFQMGEVSVKAPGAVGAALANRKYGRLSVNVQKDGDLMYEPGVLWTAAHHRIPLLTVMHNNRAFHQETMHIQRMACERNRDVSKSHIGTAIEDPNIDFAKLAQSMGWYAEGPISDPKELGPALKRAIAVVEKGEPALLDTVMQPR